MNSFTLMRASLLSFVLTITATSVVAEEVDGSIVDALVAIDGMQALVAAVLDSTRLIDNIPVPPRP